jgi:hypothetical protein
LSDVPDTGGGLNRVGIPCVNLGNIGITLGPASIGGGGVNFIKQGIKSCLIRPELTRQRAVADNRYAYNPITLPYSIYHILAFNHPAKNGMPAVKPWGFFMGNKKLAAIGSWPGVSHGKHPRAIVPKRGVYLVGETVTRASGTCPLRVPSLDHKVRYNPMEGKAIVKTPAPVKIHFTFCKGDKITHRQRCFLEFKPNYNIAPVSAYSGKQPVTKRCIRGRSIGYTYGAYYQNTADSKDKREFIACCHNF